MKSYLQQVNEKYHKGKRKHAVVIIENGNFNSPPPNTICAGQDGSQYIACDPSSKIFKIQVSQDGIVISGNVEKLATFPVSYSKSLDMVVL